VVVVAPPGHPLVARPTVDPRDLGRYPLILYELGSRTREAIENFLREENVRFEVAMETENAEIIKAMVANGNGITVLSHATIASDVRHRRLAFARLRGRKVYRETGWVYLKSDYVPLAVAEMLRLFEGMRGKFASKLPQPAPDRAG
jgi:DNA-binding transcriptional LysR family regulator